MHLVKNYPGSRYLVMALIILLLPAVALGRQRRYVGGDEQKERSSSYEAKPVAPAQSLPVPAVSSGSPPAAAGEPGGNPPASQIFTWQERNIIYATNDPRNIPPRINKRLDPPDPKQLVVRMAGDTPPPDKNVKGKKRRGKGVRRPAAATPVTTP